MNAKVGCWALSALMLFAGCVPSLNPVYTDDDLVFDAAVLGVWVQPNSKQTWQLTRRDKTSYRLVFTDKDGRQGRFIARLANLKGSLFLDLVPEQVEIDAVGFYKFHLAPIHTIYLVRRTEPTLEFGVIDFKWLEQYLTENPDVIPSAKFNGRRLITAPTADVQAFVLEHKESFTGKVSLQRQAESDNGN